MTTISERLREASGSADAGAFRKPALKDRLAVIPLSAEIEEDGADDDVVITIEDDDDRVPPPMTMMCPSVLPTLSNRDQHALAAKLREKDGKKKKKGGKGKKTDKTDKTVFG